MNTATFERTQEIIVSATAPRHDLYVGIHKALRAFMFDTLQRLGRIDVDDAADRHATLDQVDALLAACRSHLMHENEFVHRAIEARSPTSSGRIADEHGQHLDEIEHLAEQSRALRGSVGPGSGADGAERALHLYRELALFVAENLEHMQREETGHNQVLWALYTDTELEGIHDALVASVPPHEMTLNLCWMAASFAPADLAGLCHGLRTHVPAPVFNELLGLVNAQLDEPRRAKLARALA